jgi:hypothetical protein
MGASAVRWGLAMVAALVAVPASAQQPDSNVAAAPLQYARCAPCISGPVAPLAFVAADTGRPRAIEYSNAYAVRLKIHVIGSYVELPLFAAEYFLGNKLIHDTSTFATSGFRDGGNSSTKAWHSTVAGGLEVLFVTNTVTGVWNLIEGRREPKGRFRRWLHSLTMLAADAGFALTASAGGAAKRSLTDADTHRNLALGSVGLATLSTVMMWLWKD